ncbi:uncharacterized protein [Leuresthes tenuis]|uniref:uncharacterized protein n=1 Tax=Leuresthes tenuis TaxID=355514 RepID=UPI003B512AC2
MQERRNRRGFNEYFVEHQHLRLNDLKQEAEKFGLENKYLCKENIIPEYPRPEFHVSHLKHDTDGDGLKRIMKDGGFRDPFTDGLVWWSLKVGPEEVTSAEARLLENSFPGAHPQKKSFLGKFATSPAFLETSRLGSYRFTFPLEEVLEAYSEQLCSGAQPHMRVYETVLYKQEVMYVVLVHSPDNEELFSKYPLLTDDPNAVCVYRDGKFIWRPEAMCETHSYRLIRRDDAKKMEAKKVPGRDEFYVWDNVAVALHVEGEFNFQQKPPISYVGVSDLMEVEN